jgi:PIN domain nuclease of toxin-antitoxin system
MTKTNIVFDASSLMAWFRNEEGSERVQKHLMNSTIQRWIHAVNLAEVRYRLLMVLGDVKEVEGILQELAELGLQFVYECDDSVLVLAAQYREAIKSKRLRISLADCFGMAATQLKKKEGRIKFLTTDEGEFDGAKKAGLLPVEVDIIHQPSKRPTVREEKPPVRRKKERK